MIRSDFLENFIQPIFYVTNDVAKGIGVENLLPNFHIICLDDHPLIDILIKSKVKVFCLERSLGERNTVFRNTGRIIDHPLVLEYINKNSAGKRPLIIFFKPSLKVELVAKKNNFILLGNKIDLNRQFEEKTLFYEYCLKEGLPVPEGEINNFKNVEFKDLQKKYSLPLVIQFGRGWAGSTTFFINNEKEFIRLKEKNSFRKIKITKLIKGLTVLNNGCVYRNKILISPPAIQLSSSPALSLLPGATCGRQWPAGLTSNQEKIIFNLTEKIGRSMANLDYRGYFGLDFLVSSKTGEIFLSENNARLTASVPFFTKLEQSFGQIPLLVYHLFSFLEKEPEFDFEIKSQIVGSEVIARNNFPFSVKVNQIIGTGLYCLDSQKFRLIKKAYFLDSLKSDHFWLSSVGKDRIVNPEIETIRADFNCKVADNQGNIYPKIVDLMTVFQKILKLEKC